jgi:hypothetical protein
MDKYITVEATANPKDAAAYTANDVVGGLLTFTVGGVLGSGVINNVMLVDSDDEKAEIKLYLFDAAPTTIADDAAFAPVAADLQSLIAVITFATGDFASVNSMAYAQKNDLNYIFNADSKNNIYAYAVCTATPTYAADKTLHFQLRILTVG